MVICADRIASQRQWTRIRMNRVINTGPHASIRQIPNHRQIRSQKQQREPSPTAVAPVIGEQRKDENGRAFKMQQRSRI